MSEPQMYVTGADVSHMPFSNPQLNSVRDGEVRGRGDACHVGIIYKGEVEIDNANTNHFSAATAVKT